MHSLTTDLIDTIVVGSVVREGLVWRLDHTYLPSNIDEEAVRVAIRY